MARAYPAAWLSKSSRIGTGRVSCVLIVSVMPST